MPVHPREGLVPLLELLGRRLGHDFAEKRTRRSEVEQCLSEILADEKLHPGALMESLARSASGPLAGRVLAAACVRETCFFRHQGQQRLLEERLIPELRPRPDGPLVWCAGVSTGEEAWSIATQLARSGVLARRDGGAPVLATDVCAEALAVAARARYETWSVPEDAMSRLEPFVTFCDGRSFEIGASLRELVAFDRHNLAVDPVPSSLTAHGVQLILCRNVLMYFHSEAVKRAVRVLEDAMAPGGMLLVAPTEVPMVRRFTRLSPMRLLGASVFHKPVAGDRVPERTGLERARGSEP